VSSRGELAVLTDASFINQRLFRGTLARMTLDGSPRPWLESVREAGVVARRHDARHHSRQRQ
jgi:hypothetical protein